MHTIDPVIAKIVSRVALFMMFDLSRLNTSRKFPLGNASRHSSTEQIASRFKRFARSFRSMNMRYFGNMSNARFLK